MADFYHLGNPVCASPDYRGMYFAYDLLDRRYEATDKQWILLFASAFRADVSRLIGHLLDLSPSGQIVFTTDWQFGPESAYRSASMSVGNFWQQHRPRRITAQRPLSTDTVCLTIRCS